MQPQEKALYTDILHCIFARYLENYSESLYSELLKKHTDPAVVEVGQPLEASYEAAIRVLKEKAGRYAGFGAAPQENAAEGNIIYPAAFETQGADPEIAKETDYGTAWDIFDNLLNELPAEKQIECKMRLSSLDHIIHDASMTGLQKKLFASILLEQIAAEPEEAAIVYVPMLLQIYE